MFENCEDLKKGPALPSEIRDEWYRADSLENIYRRNVQKLESDGDLTPEARHRKLLDLHADQAPVIEDKRRALRESLLKAAESAERASWPRVKGTSLDPVDASALIASPHEEAALVSDYRELQKKADSNKAPFAPNTAEYLRDRYQQGLQQAGVAGAARVRGVIGAANRLGVSVEEVVGPLSSQREHEALERAQRLMSMSDVISTKISLPGSVQRRNRRPRQINQRWAGGATILMPAGGEPIQASTPTHTGTKPRSKQKGKKK